MESWKDIKQCAHNFQRKEPDMAEFLEKSITSYDSFSESLAYVFSNAICTNPKIKEIIYHKMADFFKDKKELSIIDDDLLAFRKRDPACRNLLSVLLFYKGFQALGIYRMTHHLWNSNEIMLAMYLHSLSCKTFSIDIHPAAKIASSIFIDHGNSIVIGETCVIEEGTSILQDVTLGGTGKERGDRHPKIGKGVLIGAGAKILGNIKIGNYSKVGATSVVLKDVPPFSVAVGVPAVIIGKNKSKNIAKKMDHTIEGC